MSNENTKIVWECKDCGNKACRLVTVGARCFHFPPCHCPIGIGFRGTAWQKISECVIPREEGEYADKR